MAKATNPNVFRDIAIICLVQVMAEHEEDRVPSYIIGSLIKRMTGWDNAELYGLQNAFGATNQWKIILEDSSFLLNYAPRRKFISSTEISEWIVSASSIREAVDTSAHWGFISQTRKPTPTAQWNAFLLAGSHILTQQKDALVDRERIFFLFSLLGMNRLAACRAIEIEKGLKKQ